MTMLTMEMINDSMKPWKFSNRIQFWALKMYTLPNPAQTTYGGMRINLCSFDHVRQIHEHWPLLLVQVIPPTSAIYEPEGPMVIGSKFRLPPFYEVNTP